MSHPRLESLLGKIPDNAPHSLIAAHLMRHARELEEELEAKRVVLESIRDTAIAMDDAVRTYPNHRTVICVEGPRRIKDSANRVLYPSLSSPSATGRTEGK